MNEVEYAGFWIRTWASLIDTVLQMIIITPIIIGIYGWDTFINSDKVINGSWDFLFSYVLPIIIVLAFWIYKCATPGKMAIRAKIVDAHTGEKPSKTQFIGRYFAYFVSFVPLCLGFFWVAFDKRKQGWHDKLAGTVVVRSKSDLKGTVNFAEKS